MLNKSKIEYISEDKKITTAWEKRTGLQLPFENFPIGGYKTNVSHREDIGNSAKNGIDNIPHVKRFSLDVPVQQTKDLIADRTQKMNAHGNLRFSINIDDDFDSIIDPYAKERSHEDVLKEGEEALGSVHVSASNTYRLAQKLVSDYGLTGQTRTLSADLQKVFVV